MNWVSEGRVINTCCLVLLIGDNKWMFAKHIRSEKTPLSHCSGWSAGVALGLICLCLFNYVSVCERWYAPFLMCLCLRVCVCCLHVCGILFQHWCHSLHVHLMTQTLPWSRPQLQLVCSHSHAHTHIHHRLTSIRGNTPQVVFALYVGRAVSRGHCSSMGDRCSWGQKQYSV